MSVAMAAQSSRRRSSRRHRLLYRDNRSRCPMHSVDNRSCDTGRSLGHNTFRPARHPAGTRGLRLLDSISGRCCLPCRYKLSLLNNRYHHRRLVGRLDSTDFPERGCTGHYSSRTGQRKSYRSPSEHIGRYLDYTGGRCRTEGLNSCRRRHRYWDPASCQLGN